MFSVSSVDAYFVEVSKRIALARALSPTEVIIIMKLIVRMLLSSLSLGIQKVKKSYHTKI